MKALIVSALTALPLLAAGFVLAESNRDTAATLKSADAFTSIADANQRSIALFQEAGKVIQHLGA